MLIVDVVSLLGVEVAKLFLRRLEGYGLVFWV